MVNRKLNRLVCATYESLADRRIVLSFCVHRPISAQVEITTRCNLDCRICPRKEFLAAPAQDMPIGKFQSIVDQLSSLEQIHLFGLGEPLMHRDLDKIVEYCRRRAIPRISMTTNGTMLDRAKAEMLAGSAITDLGLSLDAGDEATLELIRPNAQLSKIVDNITYFRKISNKPIQINATLTSENLPSLLLLPRTAKQMGVSAIRFRELKSYGTTPQNTKGMGFRGLPVSVRKKFLGELQAECQRSEIRYSLATKLYSRCYMLYWAVFIDVQGFVTPCCAIPEIPVMQIGPRRFSKIWNSTQIRSWRKRTCSGDFPDECVQRCYVDNAYPPAEENTGKNGMPKQ